VFDQLPDDTWFYSGHGDDSIASARRWLADSVADPEQLRAAPRDRVELVSGAAAPPAVHVPPTAPGACAYPSWWQPTAGAKDSSGGCADPTWWVWTAAGARDHPPPRADVIAVGPPGAADRVWVGATGLGVTGPARELAARRAAGAALAASPQLRADPAVTAQLRDGQPDSRALSTLAAALSRQRPRLLALPPVAGEGGPAVRRCTSCCLPPTVRRHPARRAPIRRSPLGRSWSSSPVNWPRSVRTR
jgi:hypothetical protein